MFCRLFNIGNTHVLTAELEESGEISGFFQYDTKGFDPEKLLSERMAVVSVVPEWEHYFRDRGAFLLDSGSCSPVLSLSKMGTPETIGADRIANAIALLSTGRVPAVCIDCGTAITFEYVDSESCLCGGAILPGRKLLRNVLHDYTAKLPLIPMFDNIPDVPGRNTVEAIRVGTDLGAIGAVREILERLRVSAPDLRVVFCGGDAGFFQPYFPGSECCDSSFTLQGLAYLIKQCRVF